MRATILTAGAMALGMVLCGGALAADPPKPWETLRATTSLPPAVRTGRQDVGDAQLYYAVYGRGDPVILLHPGLGNGDDWANQIGPLSQQYQVIVVDLRGHGRSTASAKPLSYRLMAQDIAHLIKAQRLKAPAIVGWGDGAVVGLELALHHPKRIGKLVAFGLAFNRAGLQPRPDQSATFIGYVHQAQADHARLSGDPSSFMATLDQLEALWEREPAYAPAALAGVKTPTTLLAAEYDEWVKPEHMAQAAAQIPGAMIIMLPRTSHFAPWQAPKSFDDALLLALRK